jgi:hypothetical protein
VSGIDGADHPRHLDATFTISKEDNSYYLTRKNGDGSSGRYPLSRDGNVFIKINDKFGAYYIVSKSYMEIYDRQGYIRTAKRI